MTIRLIVILVLALYLTSDQCHGFAEEGLRELCRKLSNTDPAKNGSSTGPSESATFSCGDCTPDTSNVHVCMHCYKTEENEAFSCRSCKIESKSKPFICDECKAKPAHDASQESDTGGTGCNDHQYFSLASSGIIQQTEIRDFLVGLGRAFFRFASSLFTYFYWVRSILTAWF